MDKDTRVFSYRRFSSGRQARGTSLERQTKLAQVWCQERGYELDESLSLSDLGVSAFKGDNRRCISSPMNFDMSWIGC